MTTRPVHTPYDGSGRPFSIGLSLLDPAEWLMTDDALAVQIAEKARLERAHPAQVWAETEGSRPAQEEVLGMVLAHLAERHAATHRLEGGRVHVAGHVFDPHEPGVPPLKAAARMIQEDLVIMGKRADGWRLVAASLSFPSSWSLLEKIDRPLDAIHGPVPGFATGTRNAGMINRIFDHLQPQAPVKRFNWSVYDNDELFQPVPGHARQHERDLDAVHIRVERQTLRKLERTGEIIFSILIEVNPLAVIMASPAGRAAGGEFAAQLAAMSEAEAAYKGLASSRHALASRILELAKGG